MKIVVHYSEIGLKGRNRPRFEDRLLANLRDGLIDLGDIRGQRLFGRLMLTLPDDIPFEQIRARIQSVCGVAYFSRVTECEPNFDGIQKGVDDFLESTRFESFGIRARRSEKRLPFTSLELERHFGHYVAQKTGARVDLKQPEVWIEIHAMNKVVFVLHGRQSGIGGLPVGISGRVTALISGGIDSPVAAFKVMRRGCYVRFVHFHSHPFTSASSQDKVRDLVAILARYQGPSRLHTVPFGEIQRQIVRDAPEEPRIILYRRMMFRIAQRLAESQGSLALVTGECVGQVSSQTLANLDSINRAATLPVLRPLIGEDKDQIIRSAEQLGTYSLSIEPDDDCCSYLMPNRPATKTRPEALERIEQLWDIEGMIKDAIDRSQFEVIKPVR